MMIDAVTTMAPQAASGKVKALGTTGKARSTVMPSTPTIDEAGVPGYEATIGFGLLAPAGAPGTIVTRLSNEIRNVLLQPKMREQFSTVDITPSSPEEFASLVRREIPKWRKVIEGAKITME